LASRELSLGRKLTFSLVVLVSFLAVAELGVRGWVYYLREEYTRYEATTGMPYLVPGVHARAGRNPVVVNQDGFVGEELQEDAPDLFRIIALGDSNTFGGGSPFYAYPAVLGQLLEERNRAGRRYEVVNAGIEGMDSHQGLYRLRAKVLEREPEIVIIYLGWNDLMKYDPFGQSGVGAMSAASRFVDRLWLVKGMRKLAFLYIRPRLNPPLTGPNSYTGRFADFRPGTYIENMTAIIREVRAAGGEPVLMTLTTVVRPDDTPKQLRNVFFPYYASAYAVGDFLSLVDAYNRAIDEISVAESVSVVDLYRIFMDQSDYRSLYVDTMHPSREGYAIVARNIRSVLEENALLNDRSGGAKHAETNSLHDEKSGR
jgi:lysophospholipase L1-like esterase